MRKEDVLDYLMAHGPTDTTTMIEAMPQRGVARGTARDSINSCLRKLEADGRARRLGHLEPWNRNSPMVWEAVE